ncbi:hypothetical protein FACS189430_07540 [Bacteroidia bacterium]|nr:hypothetical protein FACS189430_07540 [Bacteroidia bacterium]
MKNILKAWLVKNNLTPDPSDFAGLVESFGSIAVEGLIDELVKEGMELKRETVMDVVTRYNRKCVDMALRGYNVNTGLVHLHATIKGVFHNKTWNPDENSLHISISQGAELRKAAAATTVEIIGEHADLIALFGITDVSTGATDGTLTRGFNAEVKGTYIKIAGDDESCGVYLRNHETGEDFQFPVANIALNEPSRLLLLIPPTMDEGTYELRVTTQYMSNNKFLKTPRSAVFSAPLTLV